MSGKPVVMFYVQHLFGIGHVFRATRIAREIAATGCNTHLVWGGTDVLNVGFPGLDVHKLTAVRSSDETFSKLVHADGRDFTAQDQIKRRDMLLSLFETIHPDVLITEAYPFGRRQMRFELVPLTTAAKTRANRPLIISSIRDIMQENRKQSRVDETLNAVNDFYDLVFVHGDPAFASIDDSLQGADQIMDKIRYTGLVTPPAPPCSPKNTSRPCNVLVSSGGGANGFSLLSKAMDAVQFSERYPKDWRFVAGTEMPDDLFEKLKERCPENATLERYVTDMVGAMSASNVSVSRAGYNTIGDVFRAGAASVIIPFTGGRETEQIRRAQLLQKRGIATMLDENTMTPKQLAHAIDNAKPPTSMGFTPKFDGAAETAKILLKEFSKFRAHPDR